MSALFGANTQKVPKYSALQVNTSQLDIPITLLWGQRRMSTNVIWYNDLVAHSQNAKGKGGGKGGQKTYTAAVILALGEGVFDTCLNVWQQGATGTANSLAHFGYTLFTGTASQAPWSYVSTKHSTQALAYMDTGYVAHPKLDLGSTASVPNDAFEMRRLNGFTNTLSAPGWKNPVGGAVTTGIDVSMGDVIPDFLTSVQYGLRMDSGDIADMTSFQEYQDSLGLYFSPMLVNQEKATSILDRWAVITNSWIFWDGIQIRCLPLGDNAIGTYTPDLTPAYDLSIENGDFIGTPPVVVTRKDPADCYNKTTLEATDRTRGYVSNPFEYKDQTLVDLFGLRDGSSTQADEICNPTVAATVVQLIGKRAAYIRKSYTWVSPNRRILLIPGSIVTLTDPNSDLDKELVRILTVDENDNGDLNFTAQELTIGVATFVGVTIQGNGPQTNASFNQDPGNVNTPCIVEPNSSFTGGVPRLLISASGGIHWGGCHVNISFDGTNYNHIGDITTAAPQGLLTAILATYGGANPDTGHTLSVDATQSQFAPQPVTNADAQAFRTLSMVCAQPTLSGGFEVMPNNGELLAFGAVATTGTFTANLTYLERALYGSTVAAHAIGEQFSMIDVSGMKGCTLAYALPPQYIGQPVYVKLTSFNEFGLEAQDIAAVTAYKYTPTGAGFGGGGAGGGTPGTPTIPTGLSAAPGTGQNVISWAANPTTDNVTHYLLYRAAGLGASFGSAALIATLGTTTTYTDPGRPAGAAYTYFLIAQNIVGNSLPTSGVNCTTGATVLSALRISGSRAGVKPATGEEMFNIPMATGDILPWNGSGGFATAFLQMETAPTSSWTLTLKKNGSTVATGTIAASAITGTFAGLSADLTFADGDRFSATCIAPQDATAVGPSWALFGTRTK